MSTVLDAADVSTITQLILKERESRDLGRWDDMRECFFPDSHVRISWFTGNGHDFVEGSKDMARRQVLAKHRLGPVRVRLSGDRAVASLVGIIDIPAKAFPSVTVTVVPSTVNASSASREITPPPGAV